MKVLSEINLNNANIDPIDILNKHQMKNLLGGSFTCNIIDSDGYVLDTGLCLLGTMFECEDNCRDWYGEWGIYCRCS